MSPEGQVQCLSYEAQVYTTEELQDFAHLYQPKPREQVWEWIMRI